MKAATFMSHMQSLAACMLVAGMIAQTRPEPLLENPTLKLPN